MNDTTHPTDTRPTAQTLAGRAVLLELGAQLGVLDPLLSQKEVSVSEVASKAGLSVSVVSAYYAALAHAGLARATSVPTGYVAASNLQKSINDAGYILWSVMSCAPLLWNARAFAEDLDAAIPRYRRDGDHVARTSRWMGEADFYPHAEEAILARRPKKVVDLGSGTCGLLMRLLRKLPEAKAVGIDINGDACRRAISNIKAAELEDRITVIEAPIQSLVENPAPIEGAGVIHGGWVFHDLMPHEESVLDELLKTFRKHAPEGALVIVEGVPYASNPGEEAFSASYTFLHSHFMGRRLQTESEWKSRLTAAGYGSIQARQLGISGGRIFVAAAG
jgi:SAM-dependent methyltransferase